MGPPSSHGTRRPQVKFYSSYLPLLYSELWKQNQSLQGETMHARERLLRLHSRPKVLFCTNYEEAMDVYDRYRDSHVGVITDLGFPKNGVHDMSAGLQFAAHVRETSPELPVRRATPRHTATYRDSPRRFERPSCHRLPSC